MATYIKKWPLPHKLNCFLELLLPKLSLKSLFSPLLLLSLLLLLLNVRGMKGEYSLLILYTCPTWAFSYENNSSPLIPLEWEYRKLGS